MYSTINNIFIYIQRCVPGLRAEQKSSDMIRGSQNNSELGALNIDLTSCHPSGAQRLKTVSRIFLNFVGPVHWYLRKALSFIKDTKSSKSEMLK